MVGSLTREAARPSRRGVLVVLFVAVALAALTLSGCGRSDQSGAALDEPARVVDDLLRLRAERSTDASAYAECVEEVDLAIELAQAAEAEVDTTVTPTPVWEEPYISNRDGQTADVIVVWVPDQTHPDWPEATVFVVIEGENGWRTTDARSVDGDIPPPVD